LPSPLTSEVDIDCFWTRFAKLRRQLAPLGIPFLSSTTSLLHKLLEAGYDCAKPDSIVMQVAVALGMVPAEKGERNLKGAIRLMQEYALHARLHTGEVDAYFLIAGGQSGMRHLVDEAYYRDPLTVRVAQKTIPHATGAEIRATGLSEGSEGLAELAVVSRVST
jgi:hypothetical protein